MSEEAVQVRATLKVGGEVVQPPVDDLLTEEQRTALKALKEWRAAEKELERVMEADPFHVFFKGDDDELSRKRAALDHLRAATDALTGSEK